MNMLFNVSKSISPLVEPLHRRCRCRRLFRFNAIKIIIFQNVSRKPEILRLNTAANDAMGKIEKKNEREKDSEKKTVCGERREKKKHEK